MLTIFCIAYAVSCTRTLWLSPSITHHVLRVINLPPKKPQRKKNRKKNISRENETSFIYIHISIRYTYGQRGGCCLRVRKIAGRPDYFELGLPWAAAPRETYSMGADRGEKGRNDVRIFAIWEGSCCTVPRYIYSPSGWCSSGDWRPCRCRSHWRRDRRSVDQDCRC